ncbi:MAG: hypothetical protein ACRDVP_03030 [Acidimicrobiales bacterium]
MGLFSSKSPDVDTALADTVVASTDKTHRATLDALGHSQATLHSIFGQGEVPICSAWYMGMMGGNMLVVVTNQRTLTLKKDSIKQQLGHGEVAETTIRKMPNGDCLVEIESKKSRLDFNLQDSQRYEHIIQLQVGTPRVAQAVCAAVDQYLLP